MIRQALAVPALCLCAALAAAQARPPTTPPRDQPTLTTSDQAVTGARPPERPVAHDPAEERPAAKAQRPVQGPPPPPEWWQLRETDQQLAACRLALSLLGTVYAQADPIIDPQVHDCGIARPVEVKEILPGLHLEGGAMMRCDTARALGFWARDFLLPAAATLPGSPRVTGLVLGTTYDCRGRIGDGGTSENLSEHAHGNAIDIAGFRMTDGSSVPVMPRAGSGDRTEAFQRAVRSAACLYFPTVLGPGSNDAHDDHLHLDMAERRGGWRLCE